MPAARQTASTEGPGAVRRRHLLPSCSTFERQRQWYIERIFRTTKSGLDTRPVFHQSDEAISGHIFCSFLALVLRAELETRLEASGAKLEWADIIADLDRLIETTVEQDGRRFILRNEAPGCAGAVFQAVKVALPPLFRRVNPDGTDPPP